MLFRKRNEGSQPEVADPNGPICAIEDFDRFPDYVVGRPDSMEESTIQFNGGGLLVIEEGVRIQESEIVLHPNSLLLLSRSRHAYRLNTAVYQNSVLAIGPDCYFNGELNAIVSESSSIVVGADCILAFGIWLRTADPHLIYDIESRRRINFSDDILIGDHVWIGQEAMALKGSVVGSGSVLGARAFCSGKAYASNCVFGGSPAKALRRGVFWDRACTHTWNKERTEKSAVYDGEPFVACEGEATLDAAEMFAQMNGLASAQEKLAFLRQEVFSLPMEQRFYVGE